MGGPFCATDTIHDSYDCVTEGRTKAMTKARLAPGVKDLSVLELLKSFLIPAYRFQKNSVSSSPSSLILILVKIHVGST